MLKHLSNFYQPQTIGEACSLLAAKGKKNVVLGGGTYLGAIEDASIEGLVDLKHLRLTYIRKAAQGFAIGGTTPVQDILKSALLNGPTGALLQKAAGAIGSTLLRHSITIGGNIVALFPWSDLPPALLALDASVVLHDGKKERVVPIEKMMEAGPREIMHASEIVTEIRVPAFGKETGVAFTKMAKTKNDYAMITVAVRITQAAGVVKEARIALNGATRKPQRCAQAEKLLVGAKPTDELIRKAADTALKGLVFTVDFRASKEYRAEVLPVLVRRCIEESLGKNA